MNHGSFLPSFLISYNLWHFLFQEVTLMGNHQHLPQTQTGAGFSKSIKIVVTKGYERHTIRHSATFRPKINKTRGRTGNPQKTIADSLKSNAEPWRGANLGDLGDKFPGILKSRAQIMERKERTPSIYLYVWGESIIHRKKRHLRAFCDILR